MAESRCNRREFFKKLAGTGLTLGVRVPIIVSLIRALKRQLFYQIKDCDTEPVKKQNPDVKYNLGPGVIVDTTIEDIPFKLHGIAHCREFAEKYYDSLDSLVKNASMVVSEASPDDLNREDVMDTAKAYFGTIADLCKKYDKPIVYLDPLSGSGVTGEVVAGAVGGLLAINNSSKIITKNSTKRKFIKNSLKTITGFYLFMSSFSFGTGLKMLVHKNFFKKEIFYYNHILDQRNVEITNRLLKLPNMLEQNDLNNGEYVLAEYGRGHIPGIVQYLKHPVLRRIKTAMYALTYDLVDSERIEFYRHYGGSWRKRLLNLS